MREAIAAFLIGFPALFSIVNPIGGAFIFREVTTDRSAEARAHLAGQVALNSLVVMMVALWAGSYVLAFFGISLAALRVAGGLVVAMSGWHLLNSPEIHEVHKQEQAASVEGVDDVALFPLTAVALGAGRPRQLASLGWFFLGMTAAATAMALLIWVTYRSTDQLARLVGPSGKS